MSDVTLKAIGDLLDDKLDEKLKPVLKTLAQHTAALTQLLTEKKKKDDNKTVDNGRLEYLEKWAKQVSQKFGVEFRP